MSFDNFQDGKFPVSTPYRGGMETENLVSKSFQKFPCYRCGCFSSLLNEYKGLKERKRKGSFQKFPWKFPKGGFLGFQKVSMRVSIKRIINDPLLKALADAYKSVRNTLKRVSMGTMRAQHV
jgi:hypothetical protein